jgi:hypothetical protein
MATINIVDIGVLGKSGGSNFKANHKIKLLYSNIIILLAFKKIRCKNRLKR